MEMNIKVIVMVYEKLDLVFSRGRFNLREDAKSLLRNNKTEAEDLSFLFSSTIPRLFV